MLSVWNQSETQPPYLAQNLNELVKNSAGEKIKRMGSSNGKGHQEGLEMMESTTVRAGKQQSRYNWTGHNLMFTTATAPSRHVFFLVLRGKSWGAFSNCVDLQKLDFSKKFHSGRYIKGITLMNWFVILAK